MSRRPPPVREEGEDGPDEPPEGPVGGSCPDSADKSGHAPFPAGQGDLTARQGQAVDALLKEPTLGRAAAVAGVNERTLRRWLAEPMFKQAVLLARREAFGQAIGLTQKYAPVAVATLVKVMQDGSSAASAKVTAAGVLLRFGREGIELDDLAERVDALERVAQARRVPNQLSQPEERP